MGMLVIRHKVKDYNKWRPEFDRHASAQLGRLTTFGSTRLTLSLE
jgi:hypothetical protein